jgi:type I restriction-modification system DNA methylase subunit
VLANPPYVRHELLGDYKEVLKPIYPEVYNGLADLYVYFYARAHQLLRNGGVSCFISSNKWLRAGYGEKLRQHLLDAQAFSLVVDFGELPIFQTAATFPAIFLWQKQPRKIVQQNGQLLRIYKHAMTMVFSSIFQEFQRFCHQPNLEKTKQDYQV